MRQDLVGKAQAGNTAAFEALIGRYKNMAFGCALSRLGDFHLADDIVQEASISAYYSLPSLAQPSAFGAWFRTIVLNHCGRALRRQRPGELSAERAEDLASHAVDPAAKAERDYEVSVVMDAVRALPEEQREVVMLYYLDDRPQRAIAEILSIPVATVNNRLHAARAILKRRTVAMLKETLSDRKLGDDFAARVGEIVKIRGPIIDVRLDEEDGAQALDSLKIVDGETSTTFAVAQRLGGGLVRCVPVRPKDTETVDIPSFKNGAAILRGEADIQEEIGEADLSRIVDVFTAPRKKRAGILETGIKVIDLFCPLVAGGSVGLFGLAGVGKAVVLAELVRRLASDDDGLAVFGLGKRTERALGQESIRNDREMFGLVDRTGSIDNVHLVTDLAANPDYARANDAFDTTIYCSVELAARNIWPAIDPLISHSKASTPEILGQRHFDVAERARQALAAAADLMVDPVFLRYLAHGTRNLAGLRSKDRFASRLAELGVDDRTLVLRARKLEHFMGQPMMVAQPYTKTTGKHVPLEETLTAVTDILDGKYDEVSVEAFRFKSCIGEVTG